MVAVTKLDEFASDEWRMHPAGLGTRLMGGDWESAPHLELLSQKWVETAMGANRRRLAISTPPRHGKSEHGLVLAPAWYLDLYPERSFAMVTYGADFSKQWSVRLRDFIEQNPVDLRVRIRKDVRRQSHWQTTKNGNVYAIGVEGQLTGRGVHGLGVDDPHKDWREANSIVYRDNIWNWYISTARTRLDPVRVGPRPFVVVTATRWHEDDLIGRLVENQGRVEDGGLWEVINLPAVAEEDDVLGRRPGEALWPSMWPLDVLEETRDEVGPYVWEALYQGRPSPPEGTILLRKWWQYWTTLPPLTEITYICSSWDCAFKATTDSDFVVGQVWAIVGTKRMLLDQVRERMSFTETLDAIRQFKRKWPSMSGIFVEEAANGAAVIDALSNEIPGIVPVRYPEGKEARAHAVTPFLRAGNVYLPKHAPWLEDFVRECAIFPNGPNDDQVDAFTQAMIETGAFSGVTLGEYRPGARAGRR